MIFITAENHPWHLLKAANRMDRLPSTILKLVHILKTSGHVASAFTDPDHALTFVNKPRRSRAAVGVNPVCESRSQKVEVLLSKTR
jgi:hypothetical protein